MHRPEVLAPEIKIVELLGCPDWEGDPIRFSIALNGVAQHCGVPITFSSNQRQAPKLSGAVRISRWPQQGLGSSCG